MKLKVLPTATKIQLKTLEDGSVYIEGWANKAIVDRGKDLIPKGAWNVDNYKKNSIILFNHDHSSPVGKMIDVEARDEGLYVKGRISNSKDPMISRVRDLVKEGILNSFSVGIMVDDEDYKDGVNHVKSAELHEVSIVSVPMNQDSQFNLSTKTLKETLIDNIELISDQVGLKDIAKTCHILHKHDEVYGSIDDIANHLSNESGVEKEKAISFLRMEQDGTPEQIKLWLEKMCEDEEGEKASGKDDNCEKSEEGGEKEVQAVKVPKSAFESVDDLKEWAQASGWSSENLTEDGDNYLLVQRPAEQFTGDLTEMDMGDGVVFIVGQLASVENEEDESEAEENAEEGEETVEGEGGDDEAMQKGLLDGGNNPITQPIAGADASKTEINPALDQAKQTNVLLSNMVMLLQQMLEKMDKMGSTQQPPVETNDPLESSETEAELAKKMESFIIKTTERLSKLGL
jgi:HK97 family phage prohead protease